ncbi:hypothetical protein BASA83_012797 [Batrachochytrium salamandrivorans]|nr:hypothetical protein BASA83_012797 [Batrachochytrium salamandrivorans]
MLANDITNKEFIMRWNCAGAFASPNGMTKTQTVRYFVINEVLDSSPSCGKKIVVMASQVQGTMKFAIGQDLAMKRLTTRLEIDRTVKVSMRRKCFSLASENNEEEKTR